MKKKVWRTFLCFIVIAILVLGCETVQSSGVTECNDNSVTEGFHNDSVSDNDSLVYNGFSTVEGYVDEQLFTDPRLTESLVNTIVNHFEAMNNGDVKAFNATLTIDDPSDFYNEPRTMRTFEMYKNSGVYVKRIGFYDADSSKLCYLSDDKTHTAILGVTVRNPREDAETIYWLLVSNWEGFWGICTYIPESQL